MVHTLCMEQLYQVFNRAPYSKGCIYRHIQTLIRMAEDQQSPIAGPGLVPLYTVSKQTNKGCSMLHTVYSWTSPNIAYNRL